MFWREHLHGPAGIEAEYRLFRTFRGLVPEFHGFLRIGGCVLGPAHLNGIAAAVPAVGRIVSVPERIVSRKGYAVEGGVLLAHPGVTGSAVLEHVSVRILLQRAPLRRHLRGCQGMVVLGAQPVSVISCVDCPHVLQECAERLYPAVTSNHRQTRFPQGVIGLEAGEDEGVVLESVAQLRRDLLREPPVYGRADYPESLLDQSRDFRGLHHGVIHTAVAVYFPAGILEDGSPEPEGSLPAGHGGIRLLIKRGYGLSEAFVYECQPSVLRRAQAKKSLAMGRACLSPVTLIPYFSSQYLGSMS